MLDKGGPDEFGYLAKLGWLAAFTASKDVRDTLWARSSAKRVCKRPVFFHTFGVMYNNLRHAVAQWSALARESRSDELAYGGQS